MQKPSNYEIPSENSLSSLENSVTELVGGGPYKIRLPASLHSKGALGIEVALIQLIGSWLGQNRHPKILHSYQEGRPEAFNELCSAIYGIAALSLVDEVWDQHKNRLPRGLTLEQARYTIEALRNKEFSRCFKSRYFGVPYIKTPRYERENEMPFYNGGKIVNAGAFYRLMKMIVEEQIAGKNRLKNLLEMVSLEDLSDVLWELLKNSHDHGRETVSGNLLSRNFRSIIVQQQDISPLYLDMWCGEQPTDAQREFSSFWRERVKGNLKFLDLSVVDFGEGFVELARSKASSNSEEEIFLSCLEKGWSRLQGSSRGDGLTKVLNAVYKYRGWIRIRSGHFLMEKTFSENSSASISSTDVTRMPQAVTGTSVHIALPLAGYPGKDR